MENTHTKEEKGKNMEYIKKLKILKNMWNKWKKSCMNISWVPEKFKKECCRGHIGKYSSRIDVRYQTTDSRSIMHSKEYTNKENYSKHIIVKSQQNQGKMRKKTFVLKDATKTESWLLNDRSHKTIKMISLKPGLKPNKNISR